MAPASTPPGYGQTASRRQRIISLTLAALANALLLVMLFTLAGPASKKDRAERRPTTVTLLPDTVVAANDSSRSRTEQPRKTAAARAATPPKERRPAPPRSEVVAPEPPPPLNMIVLDRKSFAATDIARLPSAPAAGVQGAADDGADRSGDSQLASGKGPGGEPLYNAEWYRRPSRADLAGYGYSRGPGVGSGTIACRTAPNYRVERCIEYGETPPGSGLARAVRDAAPNFRVRPPRIGGRPLVGGWVVIRIDYTESDKG